MVCDADDLMSKEEVRGGRVFHVRGYSDIFHFGWLSFYGGGVGGGFGEIMG